MKKTNWDSTQMRICGFQTPNLGSTGTAENCQKRAVCVQVTHCYFSKGPSGAYMYNMHIKFSEVYLFPAIHEDASTCTTTDGTHAFLQTAQNIYCISNIALAIQWPLSVYCIKPGAPQLRRQWFTLKEDWYPRWIDDKVTFYHCCYCCCFPYTLHVPYSTCRVQRSEGLS